jgi:hypothetical protein
VYGISALQVDALSLVFMASYIALALPALRVTAAFGLRGGMLVGALLTALGAGLRVAAGGSYPWLLVGQAVISLGQLPLLGAPPKVSLTWFGSSEWSLATAVAVLANQAGGAAAFLLSPWAVPTDDGAGLPRYLVGTAVAAAAGFLAAALVVPAHPPYPPSLAAAVAHSRGAWPAAHGGSVPTSAAAFAREVCRDARAFLSGAPRGGGGGLLLTLAYGLCVGVSCALSARMLSRCKLLILQ